MARHHGLSLFALIGMLVLSFAAGESVTAAENLGLLSTPELCDYRGEALAIRPVSYDCPRCPCPYCPEAPPCPSAPGGTPYSTAPESGAAPSYDAMESQPSVAQGGQFAALGSGSWNINDDPAGYIDNPIVGTWLRVRYDNATGGARPDRGAFYAGYYPIPDNRAVFLSPNRVNYRWLSTYVELKFFPRLSGFVELLAANAVFASNSTAIPASPPAIGNESGLGDTIAGIKYQMYADPDRYLTFQFKTYIPTGDPFRGLGTGHASLEPGLLYLSRLSGRSYFMGELRYWIPLTSTWSGTIPSASGDPNVPIADQINALSGSVLRYGAGVGYNVLQGDGYSPLNPYISTGGLRLTAVAEFVGWSFLSGSYTQPNVSIYNTGLASSRVSAAGNTIVNMKLGLRGSIGPRSVYVGWGHALTGAPFYQDLFRLEYRRMF